MKKLSVLFAAILMIVSVSVVKAQTMATLNVAEILNAMPEKKKADQQLEAFSKAKEEMIKKKASAAQAQYQKYAQEAASQTAEINKKREEEMQTLMGDIEKMRAEAQNEFLQKQEAAYGPIEKKFNAAVTKVAEAKGYTYVIDAQNPNLIYKNGPDATADVKKALGL